LTRLLVRALGVMEVEGTYRNTCELVVKQLRKFRDSLLSVLETFIDDPLVSWRSRKTRGAQGEKHADPTKGPGDAAVWRSFVDRVYERVGDQRKPAEAADAEKNSSVAPLLDQPHDVALARARKAIITEMFTTGVDAAVDAFVAYLPVLGSDMRICGDDALAAPEEIENFFANSHEAPHRDFGDRALNRIKSKLSGTDFASSPEPSPPATGTPEPRRSGPGAGKQSAFSVNPDFFIRDSVFAESVDADLRNDEDNAMADVVAGDGLSTVSQVDRLIAEARSMDNLADAYLTGWAPFL